MFHELSNQLLVETPQGRGVALWIESADHEYWYTVVLHDSRALVTFRQHQLKVIRNYSLNWGFTDAEMHDILKKASIEKGRELLSE